MLTVTHVSSAVHACPRWWGLGSQCLLAPRGRPQTPHPPAAPHQAARQALPDGWCCHHLRGMASMCAHVHHTRRAQGVGCAFAHGVRSTLMSLPMGTSTSLACTATAPRDSRSRVPAQMPFQISAAVRVMQDPFKPVKQARKIYSNDISLPSCCCWKGQVH